MLKFLKAKPDSGELYCPVTAFNLSSTMINKDSTPLYLKENPHKIDNLFKVKDLH